MPLTKLGQKTLKKFKAKYKEKAESVFYSWLNKKPEHERKKYEN